MAARGLIGGAASVSTHGEQMRNGGLIGGAASVDTHGEQMRNGGLACGNGKGSGNKEGCGVGSHSAPRTKSKEMQASYVAYCVSDNGKDTLARRGINPAPAHYLGLRELNPPLQFMFNRELL